MSFPRHNAASVNQPSARRPLRRLVLLAALSAAALLPVAGLPTAAQATAPAPGWQVTPLAQPSSFSTADQTDQIQRVTVKATGGTFTLTFSGQTTAALDWDASASEVQAALAALSNLGPGNVEVSGGPGNETGTNPYEVTFVGSQAGVNESLMTTGATLLTGPTHTATVENWRSASSADRYVLLVTNSGAAPSVGAVTVTDNLPAGLHATAISGEILSMSGSTLTCTLTTLTCTTPTAIKPFDALEVFVSVAPNSTTPGSVVNSGSVSGGAASSVSFAAEPNSLNNTVAPFFGLEEFGLTTRDIAGAPTMQAADHPNTLIASAMTPVIPIGTGAEWKPFENFKNIVVDLPLGLVGNPQSLPQCSQSAATSNPPTCPEDTRIADVIAQGVNNQFVGSLRSTAGISAVYNVTPEHGYPAEFVFSLFNNSITTYATIVHTPAGYDLRTFVPGLTQLSDTKFFQLIFFGNPAAINGAGRGAPFLTMPSTCSGPLTATVHTDSWQNPAAVPINPNGSEDLEKANFSEPQWVSSSAPLGQISGCESLASLFHPALAMAPEASNPPAGNTEAASPSAYETTISVPQANDPTHPATIDSHFDETKGTPPLKDVTVKLPEGLAVNPASANGLKGCSDQASSPVGDQVEYEHNTPVRCPEASEIGTLSVETPLISSHNETGEVTGPEALSGEIYMLTPHAGDFGPGGGTFRLLLQIDSPRYGLYLKIPGTVSADPATGQLTASFKENPQFPFSNLHLRFRGGPRAPLANPDLCGTYTTHASMTSWSGATEENSSSFTLSRVNGFCPLSDAERSFKPGFTAGTESTSAGSYSSLSLKITRNDGEAELKKIEFTLPPGLTGKLAGVATCSEAQIKAAEANSGVAEEKSSSCPAGSQIGTVQTAAGAGSNPYYVGGKVYLAGPYEGAPVSTVVITPAVAGPFDLGDVVVRSPLFVNPETAQLTARTDQIPTILDGVPLDVRSVEVNVNRKDFTLNPTSCEKMSVTGTLSGVAGEASDSENVSSPFQVGNCGALAFKPKLSLSLKGGTKRNDHPALTATLTQPEGQANIGFVQVALPHSEFLAQEHIRTVCTRVQFAAHECPQAAIYGHAEATSPLLDQPLTGPVYLRSSSNKLPDLVADLKGPEFQPIEVALDGRVDSVHGGIRNTFEVVPDAPVSKFVLKMQGGKKGLLVNSTDICQGTNDATVRMVGQNGKRSDSFPAVKAQCGKKAKKRSKRHESHKHRSLSGLLATW